jgi:hypothetical protein
MTITAEDLRNDLIDEVIAKIKEDMSQSDETAIDGLLRLIPDEHLIQFLPEEKWSSFRKLWCPPDTKSNRQRILEKLITPEQQDKWFNRFEKRCGFVGNGIYKIENLYSNDTRELFLMFVAKMEGIDYEGKNEKIDNETE